MMRHRSAVAGVHQRAPEPVARQRRQEAGVVDVRVSQDYRIDGGRIDRERLPVAFPEALHALEQPAIDEDPLTGGLDEEARTGDRLGGSPEGDLHGSLLKLIGVGVSGGVGGRRAVVPRVLGGGGEGQGAPPGVPHVLCELLPVREVVESSVAHQSGALEDGDRQSGGREGSFGVTGHWFLP
jgi:hypothetical protein